MIGCASLPPPQQHPPAHAFARPEQTALGQLVASKRQAAGTRADSGFLLLDSVESAFASRLTLIESAQASLDLQYYAIHADGSTEALLQAILAAARRGVRVRLLLDDFNTVGPDAQVLRLAFENNIEVRLFNPLPGSRRSLIGRVLGSLPDIARIQKRMHNKVFIADNAVGITGGRNLGDAYFGHGAESNFVDLDVLAAGRIVREMSASFDRYWNDPLAYSVPAVVSVAELDALRADAAGARAAGAAPAPAGPASGLAPPAPAPAAPAAGSVLPGVAPVAPTERGFNLQRMPLVWAPALLMVDQPGKIGPDDSEADAGETVIDGLLHLLDDARREVVIVSPYFVPGQQMLRRFTDLRARGVRIRILTNSLASTDAVAAHAGYVRYRKALLEAGIELHEMRSEQEGSAFGLGSSGSTASSGSGRAAAGSGSSRASLHSKAVVVDDRMLVVGSMNLDLRSQRQNTEVALVIRSPALARQAVRQIDTTVARGAYRLELAEGSLLWRAPPGAAFGDERREPSAGTGLRLLSTLIGPLAPEEML